MDNSFNIEIADILQVLAGYYTLSKDSIRARSFLTASSAIAQTPDPIVSGKQAQKEIKGVGKSTADIIDEYLQTGKVQRLIDLENLFKEQSSVINYFKSFYGIGPVTALNFYNRGYRTLEDLWNKAKLTEAQKTGILWRDHLAQPIERWEMDLINEEISRRFDPYGIKWAIAGSYRRGELKSGDVDVLVQSRPDLNMDHLINLLDDILVAKLAQGETKYMGIMRLSDDLLGHRIDIRFVDEESWPAALLYFTGSQRFNILMRSRANELRFKTLNEYGLFDNQNNRMPAQTEEDIFNLLRVRYLPPEERLRDLLSLNTY